MKLTPAQYVVEIFGGLTNVGEIVGLSRQAIHRWTTVGTIPSRHYQALLNAAVALDIDLKIEDVVYGREL